jgi:hypothetical protein
MIEEVIIKKYKVLDYRSDVLFDFKEEAELMAEFVKVHKNTLNELKSFVEVLFATFETAHASGVSKENLEKHILSEISKVCSEFATKHKPVDNP